MNKTVSITLFSLLLFFCCNNTDEKASPAINFNGITSTDYNGSLLSNDPTDWNLSETWNFSEKTLFPESNDNICGTNDFNYIITAFPNPCQDMFQLYFKIPENMTLSFRIVDKYYSLLMSKNQLSSSSVAIRTETFSEQDTVRLYYKITGADCEIKGHGDIAIN